MLSLSQTERVTIEEKIIDSRIEYCVDIESQNIGDGWDSLQDIIKFYQGLSAKKLLERYVGYGGVV